MFSEEFVPKCVCCLTALHRTILLGNSNEQFWVSGGERWRVCWNRSTLSWRLEDNFVR